mmetsp:Transcript_111296/g.298686  ORF Transcript_111296/g.298686 Transcript_111296/m.298686 type:complete len:142 (-) Transcript_111296:11-436(-)
MVEAISRKLSESKLDWDAVVLAGFGKGAGIALRALVMEMLPRQIAGAILFSPAVVFPNLWRAGRQERGLESRTKLFTLWGSNNPSTPCSFCSALVQKLDSAQELQHTADTIPDGEHVFDAKSAAFLTRLFPLCARGMAEFT